MKAAAVTDPDAPETNTLEAVVLASFAEGNAATILDLIEKKSSVIEEQKQRIAILEEYLRLERARRFGPSSEQSAGQGELVFDEAEALAGEDDTTPAALAELQDITDTPKKRGRKGLAKQLPRHQIHIDLSEEDKAGAIDTFYTVAKEELDIVPAKARVIEYLQEKAVFLDEGERQLKAAELPRHPLKQCIASVSLLAYVIVSKYGDGLSLYGIEGILRRYGGEITRTSLANWVIRLSVELQPLINLMREHQLSYDYLQMDETRIKVLKEKGRSPSSDKWMWVAKGGPPDKPAVLFEYDPSRGKAVADRLLDGFEGYLQCDGLSSYDAVWHRQGLKQLGCFDHARRKYVEAQKASKPQQRKAGKVSKADVGLGKINALYRLERAIKDLSPSEKYEQRQKIALPLLDDLKRWLNANLGAVPKDSLTYKAIYYTLNQWPKLTRYCEDGRLQISNAGAENAIRPFAVGRRRWLFSDTPKGAHASAVHYSLVETCKANGLNPEEYYRVVLARLPYADTVDKLELLLPWNIKAILEKNRAQER